MATHEELIALGFGERLVALLLAGGALFGILLPAEAWNGIKKGVLLSLPYAPDHVLACAMVYAACIVLHQEQMGAFAGLDPEKLEEIRRDPGAHLNEILKEAGEL